jgi:tetratricopeptide (TPR) repeat protein
MPDDTDAMAFLMLGMREIKYNNLDNGVRFLSKVRLGIKLLILANFTKILTIPTFSYFQAIEMSPNDQGALIARSKCYLQLGEPDKALLDAETALEIDKNSIRAIYQKAEALYYLGKFEHSLMFFHRGLRLRPELNNFRLGRYWG